VRDERRKARIEDRGSSREGAERGAEALALVRLLHLASPALPIGAYSYSQGLEWMIECRAIHDEASAGQWIGDVLDEVVARGEAAVLWRLLAACASGDAPGFREWNAWYRASRETRELRAETEQMGASLVALATDLGVLAGDALDLAQSAAPITLPAAYALAAHAYSIDRDAAAVGYLASWLENQVLAAVKALPLGQVAGRRLLHALGARIPHVLARVRSLVDDDVASFAPGVALASMRHETQYSRLFRS
jgi:urease accessory protein